MTTKISGDNISAIANTGVTWNAVIVADGSTTLNASSGNGYFLDTNAGTIDVNLPTSPTRGDTIVLADYGNNFATNRVIVNTGGKLIDSVVGGDPGSDGFTIQTNGAVVELVFADDTAGWIIKQNNAPSDLGAETYELFIEATGGTVTTSGDYKIHTFTGDGCFVVSSLGGGSSPCAVASTVDYLVVAGGGGAGAGSTPAHAAGGGGAGGYRESKDSSLNSPHTASPIAATTGITVTTTTYPITVGAGGPAGPGCAVDQGGDGSNSVFSTITSTGGGGGSGSNYCAGDSGARMNGRDGGSGGGGSSQGNPAPTPGGQGGSGNTPPVSPSQGFPGGFGTDAPPDTRAGGGGGATVAGSPGTPGVNSGPGGDGATTEISGSSTTYAGGGGGGESGPSGQQAAGTGGSGGGGNGGSTGNPGQAGTANTGGGSGGGKGGPPVGTSGNSGGKGIVIIRYKFQ